MDAMLRRIRVNSVQIGDVALPPESAHHARDVLRMGVGDAIEVFDASGAAASAIILRTNDPMTVRVDQLADRAGAKTSLTIASALPKGNRADWMIEKLAEIGVARFVPLITEYSVVHPQGTSKLDRWNRLAGEAARQSRGRGIMEIRPPADVSDVLAAGAIYCSTAPGAGKLTEISLPTDGSITILIGPEGGWSPKELEMFAKAGAAPAMLTESILRIETAALVAAGIVLARLSTPGFTFSATEEE